MSNLFLVLESAIIALDVKTALQNVPDLNFTVFYSCREMIEQVFCARPIPDLIISQTFPNEEPDGFEIANLICHKYDIPFIFLTSREKNNYGLACSKYEYVPIPFKMDVLIILVKKILKISGSLKGNIKF